MGTIAEKLTYLAETKELIRQAIIGKGVEVPETDAFRTYADKVGGFTSITFGADPTTIPNRVFGKTPTTVMMTITIGNSVTSIGSYAFYQCTELTSITIPDSVTSIGGYAFSGCSGLTSITIPDSVTSIGGYAFSGCTGLTSITMSGSIPPTLAATNAIPTTITAIYVPAGSIDAYKAATNWASFADKFVEY